MARKLIWPLWLSHIFTQWRLLILFNPDHFPRQHKNGESPPNYLFLRTFRTRRTYFLSALFIVAESQHHEESRLIYGPLESNLLDQGFPVEPELHAFNTSLTGTPLCRLKLLLCLQRRAISLRHPATSFLGNIFWRRSWLSPTATHFWATTSFLSLNSKHDFCYVYSDAHFAQAFNAIIPSQLNKYFLPSFLRDMQHKGSLYSGYYSTFLKTLRYLRSFPFISHNIARN